MPTSSECASTPSASLFCVDNGWYRRSGFSGALRSNLEEGISRVRINTLSHLPFRAEVEVERRKRRSFGKTPKRGTAEQTTKAVDDALESLAELRTSFVDPALIVRVRTSGVLCSRRRERPLPIWLSEPFGTGRSVRHPVHLLCVDHQHRQKRLFPSISSRWLESAWRRLKR